MASETVDPIDWPLPPALHRAVPPERHECTVRINLSVSPGLEPEISTCEATTLPVLPLKVLSFAVSRAEADVLALHLSVVFSVCCLACLSA